MNLLQVTGVTKAYESKEKVLQDINIDIKKSEIVFLVGSNGAGKTTLVKILLGLLHADEGELVFDDDILSIPFSLDVKKRIGYLPDEPIFIEYLTGLENLKYFSNVYKQKLTDDFLLNLLSEYSLDKDANELVRKYSRGMRQKLSLCFLDIVDPDLIIMDEPTIGLDLVAIDYLTQHILKLKTQKKSLLITTHDMAFCQNVAEKIYVLKEGKTLMLNSAITQEKNRKEFEKNILSNIL